MNTKLLSKPSLDTIDQYLHFKVGTAECAVPYFNNKRRAQRGSLRVLVGKGSPKELHEEVEIMALKEKIPPTAFTNESLKKLMIDEGLGIDCSGLAYYTLDAESRARGKGSIDRHLAFLYAKSLLGYVAAKLRPVKNTDVLT